MVIYAVEFFNGGNDVVVKYEDTTGNVHKTSRKVNNGTFKFYNKMFDVNELEDMGIVIL